MATTVLIHEFVTGGGLIGRDLPPSWAREGSAMRRAVAADFAALPGVRVLATLDARLGPGGAMAGVEDRIIADRPLETFERLARAADLVLVIAPETGGVLADHARLLDRIGARSLGSSPGAIDLVADKGRLASHFEARGIPTPPTRVIAPAEGRPRGLGGPVAVKPVDGAGSLDTWVIADGTWPAGLLGIGSAIAQPFLPGEPRSASFLVGDREPPTLIGVGRQRIGIDAEGRLSYLGGAIPVEPGGDLPTVEAAIASVPGLRGFVGVDFLHALSGPTILEINPRPTTSFVGLARWLGPGAIAAAWLASEAGSRPGPFAPRHPSVRFDADGSILAGDSPP